MEIPTNGKQIDNNIHKAENDDCASNALTTEVLHDQATETLEVAAVLKKAGMSTAEALQTSFSNFFSR